MEDKGNATISPKYKAGDYRELNLRLSSDEVTWKLAIDMLKDRINARYFEPVGILLEKGHVSR